METLERVMPAQATDLKYLSEMLHNVQQLRIASENRARSLYQSGDDHLAYADPVDTLTELEKSIAKNMKKELKRFSPAIYKFAKDTPGLGEHLIARLIGEIGNPAIALPYHWEGSGSTKTLVADPAYHRTVGQLWAYCGHGDPERRSKDKANKGNQDLLLAAGDPKAKMLVHLIAECTMKSVGGVDKVGHVRPRSPYRDVYDATRLKYLDATHTTTCVRCGPSGKPAQPGSPLSDAHKHARALRKVGKEVLRDLWLVAREELQLSTEREVDYSDRETHLTCV